MDKGSAHDEDTGVAPRLAEALAIVLGTKGIPLRLRAWDGSEAGPEGAPVLEFRSRRALRRMLWSPGQLGISRAYVSGEIDAPGDVFASFAALSSAGKFAEPGPFPPLTAREAWTLLKTAVRLGAIGPNPAPPPEEAGRTGSAAATPRGRDAAAISHHYDVGNDFYAIVLGPSMVYSCAVWNHHVTGTADQTAGDRPGGQNRPGLPQAGAGARHAGAGRRLRLGQLRPARRPELRGRRRRRHPLQRAGRLARKRAAEAGLTDRVEIRVQDYRDVDDGPFDAISSIGMSEHVGREQISRYVSQLHGLLRPGGRLLDHAISWNAGPTSRTPTPSFPATSSRTVKCSASPTWSGRLSPAGRSARRRSLRRHYALTLRAWVQNLESTGMRRCVGGPGRARIWRIYMAASALGFEDGLTGVNQVLVQRPAEASRRCGGPPGFDGPRIIGKQAGAPRQWLRA